MLADLFNQAIHFLHFHRQANQAAEARPRAESFAENPILLLHRAFEPCDRSAAQLRNVKWLGDVVRGAQSGGLDGAFDRAVMRQHQDGGLRKIVPNPLQ
jgi:hypothetical protein